jgi:hypothetical protein
VFLTTLIVCGYLRAMLAGTPLFQTQSYTDVTAAMGIIVPGLGSGTAWGDFDGDGDPDLLVSESGYPYGVYLYRNDESIFTDVTASSGLGSEARNFAVGDYDNDGLDDVAFISFGYENTRLFRNVGSMQFQDVSVSAGIYGTYSWRCSWSDYDDDGLLDLYLCGTTAYLFRNLGNGTFENMAPTAGMQAGGRSCAWLDYDNDGDEDCYVGRTSTNLLYRNDGDGTFTEVGASAGVADPWGTSGVCSGDYDGDGFFDLYSVNISSTSNRLYRNLGNGTFQEVTASSGTADVGDGRTATFLDIDYDGLVDLFSSNHVNPNRLYRNNGNGTFSDIAPALNLASPPDPFGTGFCDYDGDGDIDVFLATHFGNKLLRCDGVANHFIRISLVGTVSNRNAIGAVVQCQVQELSAFQRVDGGHGMGDTDSRTLGFGLGDYAGPFEITVSWPSGLVETYQDLSPDTHAVITEGQGTGTAVGEAAAMDSGLLLLVTPVPSSGPCTAELFCPGGSYNLVVFDAAGRAVIQETLESSDGRASLTFHGLCPGIYRVAVFGEGTSAAAAMVVLP